MYFCLALKEIDNIVVVNPFRSFESEEKVDGMVCINYNNKKWSKYFELDEGGNVENCLLWNGWLNLPKYSFNQKKWDSGEDPFEPYDFSQSTHLKKWSRRRKISNDIRNGLPSSTEAKKTRKAFIALLDALENISTIDDLKNIKQDTAIQDFLSLSDHIVSKIQEFPKDKIDEYIDLKKENGTE